MAATALPATTVSRHTTRLFSIDMLRGLAALAVVLFHATSRSLLQADPETPTWLAVLIYPFSFGFSGVFLFFVISGFCIHMRWAKATAAGGSPDVAFLPFWKRRIRRLYPPYLVALVAFLLALAVTGKLMGGRALAWDVFLHTLMLHNLRASTVYSINGVFWTLAIEEQLYLAYFLLLVMRRRLGWRATLVCCFAARLAWFVVSFALHRLGVVDLPVTEAAFAHWGVWALGAWSVEAYLGLVPLPSWCRDMRLWALLLSIAMGLCSLDRMMPKTGLAHNVVWLLEDPTWGLAFFVLLCWAIAHERQWHEARARSRWLGGLRGVGIFSYSLYLTHELVLTHFAQSLAPLLDFSIVGIVLLRLFVLTPLCVACAWLFFLVFERPFLSVPAAGPTV